MEFKTVYRKYFGSMGNNLLVITLLGVFVTLLSSSNVLDPNNLETAPIFTVIIDVGHGGEDRGSHNLDLLEKDLVLAISQTMAKIEGDPSIRFIYTRNSDAAISLKDRVALAQTNNADLFVSLHINHSENSQVGGLEIYYSKQNLNKNLSKDYSTVFAKDLKWPGATPSIKTGDFLVLKESTCPAVLLNLGFISNQQDRDYLISEKNQEELANQIVKTIAVISKM